jgi:peroxiredoxin
MTPSAADGHDRKQLATERPVTESRIEREGLKAGTRAPLFSQPDLHGRAISLEEYRGRRVLLVFSDPNCGPCNALAPELVRLDAENSALQLLMVSRGDLEENRLKAREHGFAFPLVLQDKWNLSKEYGIFATPVAFLIDEEGVIEKPVAIGADGILELAGTPAAPSAISRWRAIGRIAAGLITALVMTPLRAAAALVCPPGRVNCGRTCADLRSDPRNCGACGRACPPGQGCRNGTCRPARACPPGQVLCAGKCVNVTTDPLNCGACGKTCSSSVCMAGVCSARVCPAGQVLCNGKCVNLSTDPLNCGACGRACPSGACIAGQCRPCAPGQILCAGKCVNLSTDPLNCGACGKTCAPGQTCQNGVCISGPCPPGRTNCNGACVDIANDPLHCGGCGNRCRPGQSCKNGVCA